MSSTRDEQREDIILRKEAKLLREAFYKEMDSLFWTAIELTAKGESAHRRILAHCRFRNKQIHWRLFRLCTPKQICEIFQCEPKEEEDE